MQIKDIHEFINQHPLINLLCKMDEENIFYFKSKYKKLEYLAWGDFSSSSMEELSNDKRPAILIGDFDGKYKILKSEDYILNIADTYNVSIKRPIKDFNFNNKKNTIKQKLNNDNQDEIQKWANGIQKSLESIERHEFSKIVLSRDVKINFDEFNWQLLVLDLLEKNQYAKETYFIFYKTSDKIFISFSPERLFLLEDNKIESIALAGSTSLEEANDLILNDQKLIHEHQIVIDEIKNRMEILCDQVETSTLEVMSLNYIAHRSQKIQGRKKSNIKIDDIINLLHPTPAVGTMPKEHGGEKIFEIEERKRNHYAAPIGIITNHVTELAVGIRSATIYKNELNLHTGCGIVKGSEAKREWIETENKLKPFTQALGL